MHRCNSNVLLIKTTSFPAIIVDIVSPLPLQSPIRDEIVPGNLDHFLPLLRRVILHPDLLHLLLPAINT